MRLLQFFKWWWRNNDWFNHTIAVGVAWLILCVLFSFFIGKTSILFGLIGILGIIISWIVYGIFCWLRGLWREFDAAVPTEETRIIRRLKGTEQ